jgi:hypothetical protein
MSFGSAHGEPTSPVEFTEFTENMAAEALDEKLDALIAKATGA